MSIKKILLAGTAIVAISAFSMQAQAAAITSGATGTWASTGAGGDSSVIGEAVASDTVDLDAGATLTVTNDNAADDGGGVLTFTLGAVTNTAGTGNIAIVAGASAGVEDITIASVDIDGGFSSAYASGTISTGQIIAITGDMTVGTTFGVVNSEAVNAETVAMTVGGALDVTGLATLTGGVFAGATSTLTVTGNSTFTAGITVAAGAGAGSDADLILAGATNTGDIVLTNGALGTANLVFSGAADQTVAGDITGNGDMTVAAGGTNNVDFTGLVTAGTVAIATTGEVEFDLALATDVTFTAAGTLDLDATLTGSVDFDTLAGTVVLADAFDITVNVDATGGAAGTLTLEGTSTIGGNTGASNELTAININGVAGKTATFTGTVDATTITTGAGASKFDGVVVVTDLKVGGTGAVDLNAQGTGAMDFDADGTVDIGANWVGAIDASTASYGTVNFSAAAAGVTTVGATNKLKAISITGAATTVAATDFVAPLTLSLGDNNILAATGTFDSVSGDNISTVISDNAGDSGQITAVGVATVPTGTILTLSLASDATIANTEEVTVLTAGTYTGGTLTIKALTPGFTWTDTSDATNLKVTAATAAITSNDDLTFVQVQANDGTGVFTALNTSIDNANTYVEKTELVEATQPAVDGSSSATVMDVVAAVQGVTDTRIASLRTGMAAGSMVKSSSAWMQAYYNYADQDVHEGFDGYKANTGGVVFGIDRDDIVENAILGLAVNYGTTSAESENANRTDTDIDNYGVTLYGNFAVDEDTFVNAQIGYASNDIETTRNACGGAALVCSGDTESSQFYGKLLAGRDFATASMMFTPKVYASYVKVDTDGYTETGTGTLLVVNDSDVAALNVGVDLEASWEVKARDGIMKPSFNLGYAHDVINDAVDITSTFAAGGAAFKTTGAEAGAGTINAGFGVVYETNANWDLSASYEASIKEDYQAHNGTIRLSTNF